MKSETELFKSIESQW